MTSFGIMQLLVLSVCCFIVHCSAERKIFDAFVSGRISTSSIALCWKKIFQIEHKNKKMHVCCDSVNVPYFLDYKMYPPNLGGKWGCIL